jgi:hypothetical protein
MFDQIKKWLRAWKNRGKEVLVHEHFRSAPSKKPQKAKEETKTPTVKLAKEFIMSIDVDGTMAMIADARIAEALLELRSGQETKDEASRLQMDEICRRFTEIDDAIEKVRTATVAGADHVEELNRRLTTHEAAAADVVDGINTRLTGLREEIAKETADRHGEIGHLHATLTEKISTAQVEQMFQKLRAELAVKDRDNLLKEGVNDGRLREVEVVVADIRVEAAGDAERIGELRHDIDAQREATEDSVSKIENRLTELERARDERLAFHTQAISALRDELQTLKERLNRNREVRISAFTMRSEESDDGVMTLAPIVHRVSQAGASD